MQLLVHHYLFVGNALVELGALRALIFSPDVDSRQAANITFKSKMFLGYTL